MLPNDIKWCKCGCGRLTNMGMGSVQILEKHCCHQCSIVPRLHDAACNTQWHSITANPPSKLLRTDVHEALKEAGVMV